MENDVAKCTGGNCEKKAICERYVSAPQIMTPDQAWMDPPYYYAADAVGEDRCKATAPTWCCPEFIEIKPATEAEALVLLNELTRDAS